MPQIDFTKLVPQANVDFTKQDQHIIRSVKVLPLSSLLSQALVAFVIEFDNEFEHLVPHRTTDHGSTNGLREVPWLVSMAMWVKLMQFVPPEGITAGALYRLTDFSLAEFRMYIRRMSRWGYVSLGPRREEKPTRESRAARLVSPTPGGLKALEAWRPLTSVIESRWNARFGKATIEALRKSMQALLRSFDDRLPDSLPILGYDALSEQPKRAHPFEISFPALLSKTLLAFALEYESSMKFSLAIASNALRLVGPNGVRMRDLPRLSGIAKPGIDLAIHRLFDWDLAVPGTESAASETKLLTLTAEGRRLQEKHGHMVQQIEKRWRIGYGIAVEKIRSLLEELIGDPDPGRSGLLQGLKPYPDGWRAAVPKREVLPHYPMFLHRGGFPDGS